MFKLIKILIVMMISSEIVIAGPVASITFSSSKIILQKYKNFIQGAICSSGCAAVAVACYSAAGAVFGTVTAGVGTPAAILACNSAFGTCMASCAAALALPTP
jgi:hypothetical protein